jgi:3',5'-cyclic AMP phosphodiesterase CpdA
MRIAHFSDLHVLDWNGVSTSRFLNKRLTGWANIRFKRGHIHRADYVRAIAREVRSRKVDHVVISGDLTNLALEPEFELAHTILEDEMGLAPDEISIVPGNHDLYTQGALRSRRFTSFFSKYTKCDIDVAVDIGVGHFPYVKLRGPVAVIGLSSAVPRPPLVASGKLGQEQLGALSQALVHPEVRKRTPVLVLHHPVHNPPSQLKTLMNGLADADALADRLAELPRGLLLHGHLHRRIQRILPTKSGAILAVGATSASLHHEDDHKMAGFNLYDIDDRTGAISNIEAHVLDANKETFRIERIPEA